MNTQSKLILVKQGKYQYVYIYFKHKDQLIRINTGNMVVPNCMTKEHLYNSKMKDHDILNNRTKSTKSKVDEYIRWVLGNRFRKLSKEECLKFVYSDDVSIYTYMNKVSQVQEKELLQRKPKTLNEYLKHFYQFKKNQLNNRPSYKGYLTLNNSLMDYQKYYKIELTFEMMNTEEFMVSFRNFLSEKLKDGYLTKGGLNDNTINKRFSLLKTLFIWLETKEVYTFKKVVHNFSVTRYDNTIVVLDKKDISKLLRLRLTNPTWKEIRDVFVCNCFLGLRISDLKTLTKSDFHKDSDGDYILIKENQKTNLVVQIPIQKTSLRILKRYDFELPRYSDQHFNRELKKMLEVNNLFPEPITKVRRVNKNNQDKVYLKRELISSHTCRRTFITLGISSLIPINTLMLSTGHKQIQTLQKYMKKVQDKESFKRIDL